MNPTLLPFDLRTELTRAYSSEKVLQDDIQAALQRHLVPHVREHRFTAEDIVDFMLPGDGGGGLALEVKVDGGLSAVTRQLHRYAQHREVRAVVLVTTKLRHAHLPRLMNGKPVEVVHLIGGSL